PVAGRCGLGRDPLTCRWITHVTCLARTLIRPCAALTASLGAALRLHRAGGQPPPTQASARIGARVGSAEEVLNGDRYIRKQWRGDGLPRRIGDNLSGLFSEFPSLDRLP